MFFTKTLPELEMGIRFHFLKDLRPTGVDESELIFYRISALPQLNLGGDDSWPDIKRLSA